MVNFARQDYAGVIEKRTRSVVLLALHHFPGLKAMAGVFWRNLSSIVAVFSFFFLALHTPSATAANDLPVMKLNLLQTRKRCKWPSAKRAPGRHPGLFQISRLFRTRFSADFSPGQEEQPMFWLKDNLSVPEMFYGHTCMPRDPRSGSG